MCEIWLESSMLSMHYQSIIKVKCECYASVISRLKRKDRIMAIIGNREGFNMQNQYKRIAMFPRSQHGLRL